MQNGYVILKEWLPEADQDDPSVEIVESNKQDLRL